MPVTDYHAKREAQRLRLEARAEKLRKEAAARWKRGDDMFAIIPFGQPILVGHHSENRDRSYRARAAANLDKGLMLDREAAKVEQRVAGMDYAGISSDNPDAIALLKEKLAERETRQEKMKAANKVKRGTYAAYQLSNNNAVIRDTKARIERLEREATREDKVTETNLGFTIHENTEANRVQIIFPGKPDAATRTLLKQQGFRWAPGEGAWQRHLNNAGIYAARYLIQKLTPKEA